MFEIARGISFIREVEEDFIQTPEVRIEYLNSNVHVHVRIF
jgi:hypothetical protein